MRLKGFGSRLTLLPLLLAAFLFFQCGGSRYLALPEVKEDQSVKLFLKNGKVQEGIVKGQNGSELQMISASDHQPYTFSNAEISRIELSASHYDHRAYPISDAEIEKYKNTRNTWGYAIGGAVVGGLAGLAIGYPIWVANDNPPPLFIAGIGAVIGSIYFATRGIKKDQQAAVQKVRYLRDHEYALEEEKNAEQKRLDELNREKEELQKKLEEKKKD